MKPLSAMVRVPAVLSACVLLACVAACRGDDDVAEYPITLYKRLAGLAA